MFLDVVGSTTLARQLDLEAISAVMDDALARGTVVVQAHRGKVLQYAGDNILAVVGADEAREDDIERAVHCGLALLEHTAPMVHRAVSETADAIAAAQSPAGCRA